MQRSALLRAVTTRERELAEVAKVMAQRELRQGPGAGKVVKPKPKNLPKDGDILLGIRPAGDPSPLTLTGGAWAERPRGTQYKDVATSVTEAYLSALRAGRTPAEALAAREAAKAQGEHPVAPRAAGRGRI